MTEAWSPFTQGACLTELAVVRVASGLGRTPAHVVLRWHRQRGDVVFPRTITLGRKRETIDVFDFELSAEDMDALSALHRGESGRTGSHPDENVYIPALPFQARHQPREA